MTARRRLTSRAMEVGDGPAVAELLERGFIRWRDGAFWQEALQRMADRSVPPSHPHLGWVLTTEGRIVGALLALAADSANGDGTRINLSSWYIEPEYRLYGSLLVNHALRLPGTVLTNVSPAPETWTLLKAQGYRQYVAGRAIVAPLLALGKGGGPAVLAGSAEQPGPDLSEYEAGVLRDHLRWNCLSLVCRTPSGRVPFVFGLRRKRGVRFAYLLYCRNLDSFATHARQLGWFLLQRGIAFVVTDADARPRGIPGFYQNDFPKFFRGGTAPRAGDLAYSERAILGV